MSGTVKVGVDKGCLRLQFPSSVSKEIWNVRQKYKSLGLSDTPENRAKAQELAAEAQKDILFGKLDVSLEKYNPFALQETIKQEKPKTPALIELYNEFTETVINPKVGRAVFLRHYRGFYLRIINSCASADIVADSIKIFDTVKTATTPAKTRRILNILYNLLEWSKRRGFIGREVYNPYKDYKKDVLGKSTQIKPKRIVEQGWDGEDDDHRGYNPKEARYIIEAFSSRGHTPKLYQLFVSFLFLTGCRPSEAVGLRWEDINEDCTTIVFRHVLCYKTKEERGLKTAAYGKAKRKFPCGKHLQDLLKEIKGNHPNPQPKSKVFLNRQGKPIDWSSYYYCWAGINNADRHTDGVIEALIKEGKLKQYLKPYSTRHSFITWQLANGMTPANVAKLVGNSPEMIYKHYVSADNDIEVAFEL